MYYAPFSSSLKVVVSVVVATVFLVLTCCCLLRRRRRRRNVELPQSTQQIEEIFAMAQENLSQPATAKMEDRMRTVEERLAELSRVLLEFGQNRTSMLQILEERRGNPVNYNGDQNAEPATIEKIEDVDRLHFKFDIVKAATNDFSDDNKLGQGGFGTVYKGLLSNGVQVAVKRLAKNSGQGETEFKNEVLLLVKLQHRNLVRLLGFCLEKDERILVYEFVPNSSLDYFLLDPGKRGLLDWETRGNIIRGIARGLLYLHEDSRLRIIHRDLKPSNVLLDAAMTPKIADFGLARLFQVDQTQGDTSKVAGTYGYMAPEYTFHGIFSAKSDVYSFGVLVLELITGRRSIGVHYGNNSEHLTCWVWRKWKDGKAANVVDETMPTDPWSDIMRVVHIGLLCVQEEAADRPTMSSVVIMLSSHSINLPVVTHPAYITRSQVPSK